VAAGRVAIGGHIHMPAASPNDEAEWIAEVEKTVARKAGFPR